MTIACGWKGTIVFLSKSRNLKRYHQYFFNSKLLSKLATKKLRFFKVTLFNKDDVISTLQIRLTYLVSHGDHFFEFVNTRKKSYNDDVISNPQVSLNLIGSALDYLA